MIKINLLSRKIRSAEAKRRYYQANKEKIAKSCRAYYLSNRERLVQEAVEYRKNKKDHIKAYREANKERLAEYGRARWSSGGKEYKAKYKEANPERWAEMASRQKAKKRGHAPLKFLPGETIARLIEQQKGLCPICDQPLGAKTAIDHCHDSGRVRAVTHFNCNSGIGLLGESPETLERAAAYIRAHRARISGPG